MNRFMFSVKQLKINKFIRHIWQLVISTWETVECLVIVVKSMGLGRARRCGLDFNVIILSEGAGEEGKPQRMNFFLWRELTPFYTRKAILTM